MEESQQKNSFKEVKNIRSSMKLSKMRCLVVLLIPTIIIWNVYLAYTYSGLKFMNQMTNISLCLQARYGSDPFLHKHLYTCPTILKKSFDSLTIFETQRNAEINACFGSYLSPTSYPKRCDIEIKQGYRISFIAMKPLIRHRKLHNRTLVPILSLNKWDNGTKYIAKVVDGNDCKKLGGEYEVLQFYGKKNEKPTFYFDYPLLTNCNTIQVFPDRYTTPNILPDFLTPL